MAFLAGLASAGVFLLLPFALVAALRACCPTRTRCCSASAALLVLLPSPSGSPQLEDRHCNKPALSIVLAVATWRTWRRDELTDHPVLLLLRRDEGGVLCAERLNCSSMN